MMTELHPRHLARWVIVLCVVEALRTRPDLKREIVIDALDTAMQSDCLQLCAEVTAALEA